MKKIFVMLMAMFALTQVAHATVVDIEDNGYIVPGGPRPYPEPRPNPRPDPYPGPGYPHPRPEPRPPQPYPGPGYPPQPPYGDSVDYLRCDSYNWNYQECYFSPYRVSRVTLIEQNSYDSCIYNQTYGVYQDRIWVTRGCSGTFAIYRY
ncbi:DUF3011 domain-containing protein [Bdellovibrio svalbardensis]|uniref:DUF3011 domain-containing protein n=1 Tax=Bdellovibrio svalbardensis TaxID=2972972 RepID=A0ABT6DM73_9BACT|nr:DUF3011 domain-containing protein [Bdellovibrio svalbardensis]MDG0817975.1 DUF3011 domain-containing protein [Bdellovibrio svalbardensis]